MEQQILTIPKGWHDVKLKQLPDIEDAMNFQVVTEGDKLRKWNRILAAVTGKPLKEIESLPFAYVISLYDQFPWLEIIPKQQVKEFTISDRTFHVQHDIYNASGSQFAGLSDYVAKDGYYKIAESIAIMCNEVGKQPDTENAQLFWDECPCDVAISLRDFFLSVYEKSLPIFQNSMNNRMKEIKRLTKETLMEMEAGT